MQYKLDLWSKYGFNLKRLLLPQLPLDATLNQNCEAIICIAEIIQVFIKYILMQPIFLNYIHTLTT